MAQGVEMIKKYILSIILSILIITPVFATTYYVDPDAGDDTAAGTIGVPWEHLPGTRNAGDTDFICAGGCSGWAGIVADDTIKIKSGTTHGGGQVQIDGSYYADTTLANPITIQRDTTWGTGSVIFDGTGVTVGGGGWGLIHIRRQGGYIIDGVAGVGTAYDGFIVQDSAYCGISTHPGNTTAYAPNKFQYIKFHNNGTTYSAAENASDGQLRIYHHTTGTIVNYCEFSGNSMMLQGISMGDSSARVLGATVSNCVAYNHAGTDDGGIGFKAQNSQITWTNCTSYSNYKGFDLGENGGTTSWDITYKLVNCTAYSNDFGANFSLYGYEGAWSGAVNFYLINCVIRDNSVIGSKVYAGPFNLYVVHSVYDNNPINLSVNRDGLSDANTINAYIYNSIFYKPTGTDGNVDHLYWEDVGDPMDVDSDYNSYIQNDSEYFKQTGGYGGGSDVTNFSYGANGPGHASGTWYDFQSWNNDANSVGTGATDTTEPPFTDVSGHDYTLTVAYVGLDISGLGWYTSEMGVDRDSVARVGDWDMGAYEFASGAPPPVDPPAGLAITGGTGTCLTGGTGSQITGATD